MRSFEWDSFEDSVENIGHYGVYRVIFGKALATK